MALFLLYNIEYFYKEQQARTFETYELNGIPDIYNNIYDFRTIGNLQQGDLLLSWYQNVKVI